ncbi:MAG: DNA double-strand break repair nuclease NurA [Bacteroidales bacterium]|nr:DNA double-strand break repair nuclease NurA [Bacteroidales bacterium]
MDNLNINLVNAFNGVLDNLVDGAAYAQLPPRGPRDLATLSEAEIESKKLNEFGESLARDDNYSPKNLTHLITKIDIEDSLLPKEVKIPTSDDLDGITICGIDGSNQKVEKNSFYFILARAAIVNFRYTKGIEPPYFFTKKKDASAVTWVDGNIFKENVIEHTNNKLKKQKNGEKSVGILNYIKQDNSKPFMVGYDHLSSEKSPSGHALGWAVKFQQALELLCLEEIEADISKKTICIKDGPLYSTSSAEEDSVEGMRPTIQWNNQVLVCVSKRINDSKLILETLCSFKELLRIYFPGDEVNEESIYSIGTDSLLLQRILKPGHRTPLIKAVPIARQGACKKATDELFRDFMPLCCYYRGKTRPQTFIRLEIPFFMYENSKQLVEEAIAVVAWQHELGGKAPYIQLVADDLCQLNYEKELLEKQTIAALSNKKLELAEQY